MIKSLKTTLAAILLASTAVSGTALADGDYYEGASKQAAISSVDRTETASIGADEAAHIKVAQLRIPTSRDNRMSGDEGKSAK